MIELLIRVLVLSVTGPRPFPISRTEEPFGHSTQLAETGLQASRGFSFSSSKEERDHSDLCNIRAQFFPSNENFRSHSQMKE